MRSSCIYPAAQVGTASVGAGSCVIDDYVTKIGHHPFHEIACLVEGAKAGSVVVAAAPSSAGNRVNATLERVVSSYLVR